MAGGFYVTVAKNLAHGLDNSIEYIQNVRAEEQLKLRKLLMKPYKILNNSLINYAKLQGIGDNK